jgi:prevent-host-death family protein
MKTATVRQLRHDFQSVLTWVEQGQPVEISKRGKIIALLSPPPVSAPPKRRQRPDFAASLKRIFGNKVVSGDIVLEERDSRPY